MAARALTLLALLLASGDVLGRSDEKPLAQGWSALKVLVVEDASGRPVVGAHIEQACRGCIYASDRAQTDTNGFANVKVFEKWVLLKATKDSLSNSVSFFGTNAVSSFRTNAVIRLKKAGK
jgi:hypothetical protein